MDTSAWINLATLIINLVQIIADVFLVYFKNLKESQCWCFKSKVFESEMKGNTPPNTPEEPKKDIVIKNTTK